MSEFWRGFTDAWTSWWMAAMYCVGTLICIPLATGLWSLAFAGLAIIYGGLALYAKGRKT